MRICFNFFKSSHSQCHFQAPIFHPFHLKVLWWFKAFQPIITWIIDGSITIHLQFFSFNWSHKHNKQTNRLQKCEANITQSNSPNIIKKQTRWAPLNFCHLFKSNRKTLNPKHDVSLHVKGHKPTTVKSALTVQQASEGVGENLTWKISFWDLMIICAIPTTSSWVGRCKHIKQCTGSESSESMDVSTCCWV